VNFLDALI